MKKVLLIGSANMDLSMNLFRVPNAGETLLDDGGIAYTPGGKGANAAIALSRLGAESVLCAKLGADIHGQKLYNYYKDNKKRIYKKIVSKYETIFFNTLFYLFLRFIFFWLILFLFSNAEIVKNRIYYIIRN